MFVYKVDKSKDASKAVVVRLFVFSVLFMTGWLLKVDPWKMSQPIVAAFNLVEMYLKGYIEYSFREP